VIEIVKKLNWNKCEKEKYRESVQQSLEKLDTSKVKDSTWKISEISDILHLAGNAGIPDYGKVITIKPVGKGIWNREIAEASKTSKLAFYEWKQDKRNNTKHSDMKSALCPWYCHGIVMVLSHLNSLWKYSFQPCSSSSCSFTSVPLKISVSVAVYEFCRSIQNDIIEQMESEKNNNRRSTEGNKQTEYWLRVFLAIFNGFRNNESSIKR
jgi:uncharacterized protein (UPF0248 family)